MVRGRAIAVAFAGLAIVIGICFGGSWYTISSSCDKAEAIDLASFADGFGKTGDHVAAFCPEYAFTCKEMLCVIPDSRVLSREDAEKIVSGVNASLRIVSPSGVVVGEWELTNEAFSRTWRVGLEQAGPFPAFRFSPVPPGEYTIELNVQQPAAALVEIPHRVVAKYELCGIERLPALFSGAISVTFVVIGGVVAAVALWPRKAKVAAADQPADTN